MAIIVAIFCAACEGLTGPSPMPPAGQPGRVVKDVSGTYTLTIAAADGCGVGLGEGHLPEEARVRIYEADVQRAGAHLIIWVGGSTVTYGTLLGKVEPEHVIFDLAWYDDGGGREPSIIERLPTSGFLAVRGIVIAADSANRLAGALRGDLSTFATDNTWRHPIAWCSSDGHRFALTR